MFIYMQIGLQSVARVGSRGSFKSGIFLFESLPGPLLVESQTLIEGTC